jgi:hypothetical protein
MRLLKLWQRWGDMPDKARHEIMVGARHRLSALERYFCYQKAASRAYTKPILEIIVDQEINRLRSSELDLWRSK